MQGRDGTHEQVPMEVEEKFDKGESKNWFPQNASKNKHWELWPYTIQKFGFSKMVQTEAENIVQTVILWDIITV